MTLHTTRIPGTLDDALAEREAIAALPAGFAPLAPETVRTPLMDLPGGVDGQWVTARDVDRSGAVIYLHGGGFQHRIPELAAVLAHEISAVTRRPAFAVHYRLAPAHPYPAAVEDVLAVYRGLLGHGIPPEQIILAGGSAGATLALSALLILADAAEPLPGAAVLGSPLVDFTLSAASFTTNADNDTIDLPALRQIRDAYLKGAAPDAAPQSPLHGRLDRLPALHCTVGSREVLLDDIVRFVESAGQAGTDVTLDIYEQMPHGFGLPGRPSAETHRHRLTSWLAAHPTTGPTTEDSFMG